MSLNLSLHTSPDVPLEAEVISPDSLSGLSIKEIESQSLLHGNEKVCIADFFKVTGKAGVEITIEGDLSQIKFIGAEMTTGKMNIVGSVGVHLGAGMAGLVSRRFLQDRPG